MKRAVLAVLAAAVLAGCQDVQQPPAANFLVSDGANGGNPHFFFLPPIVPTPTYSGVFDPSVLPYVKVEIRGPVADPTLAGCGDVNGPVFTTFGAGDVSVASGQYAVGWQTGKAPTPAIGSVYRICVRLQVNANADAVLGYRDVQPDDGGANQPRNTEQTPIYQFSSGSNIPIKFRIETGALSFAFCGLGVEDCTAKILGTDGGQAVCDNATCGLTVPQGGLETSTLFVIERLTCTTNGDGSVNWLAIDIPQYGGCLRVTGLAEPEFKGLLEEGTVAACWINSTPLIDESGGQQYALQLHLQREDGTAEALPQREAAFLNCEQVALSPSASPGQRLAYYARTGLRKLQQIANPWFAPPPLEAFHTGFGGGTTLSSGGSAPPAGAAVNPSLPSGLSLQETGGSGGDQVFKLAWALPSQMAKVGWVNPVIGNVGDVKTATVQVTDNGVDRNGVFGTPRPVRGATVTFQVTSGSPLPGEPVKVLTGADGLASVNWPFTPAGGLELRASGFGIGLTVVEGGTGPFADHFTNEVPLDTGRLFFRGFACGAGDPTLGLTSATVDGKIGPGEYQNAEMHTFPVSLGGNNSSTGTLYIGNDCQNLYLAFVVGVDESTNNSLRFVFDNTPPQGESADDDILSLSKVSVGSWMFRDRFLSQACVGSKQADCGPDDVSAGGTSDGAGAASFDVGIGKFVYEFRHPLKSGDASHDFQRAFGQSVGYYLAVSLGTGSKGNTEWPDQKGNFKNYQTYVVRGPTLMP